MMVNCAPDPDRIDTCASLLAQSVKSPPAMQEMQETRVQFLGLEDSPGEGNDNPFQHSCLGNPMDRGAWRAGHRLRDHR